MARFQYDGPAQAGDSVQQFSGTFFSQMTVQAAVSGPAAVAAKVAIEGSLNGIDWVPIMDLDLGQQQKRSADGGMAQTNWDQVRVRVVEITQGAQLNVVISTKGFAYGA